MLYVHPLLDYHKFGNSELAEKASEVNNGINTNSTVFTTPPVTATELIAVLTVFVTAAANFKTYGSTKKTALDNARADLSDTLDQLAGYVDTVANGDASIVILSGFTPSVAEAQKSGVIDQIKIILATRTAVLGGLHIETPAIVGYGNVTYACIISEGAPLSNPVFVKGQLKLNPGDPPVRFDATKSRKKDIEGLNTGVMHFIYLYAINSAGVSPLSDPFSIMM